MELENLKSVLSIKLTTAKRSILNTLKKQKTSKSTHLKSTRHLPFLLLRNALRHPSEAERVVVRESDLRKRPSVLLQVEEQSFLFDGATLSWDGKGVDGDMAGLLDEISNVLKKHIKK